MSEIADLLKPIREKMLEKGASVDDWVVVVMAPPDGDVAGVFFADDPAKVMASIGALGQLVEGA